MAGPTVLAYLNERNVVVKELGDRFKAQPSEIVEQVTSLAEEHWQGSGRSSRRTGGGKISCFSSQSCVVGIIPSSWCNDSIALTARVFK